MLRSLWCLLLPLGFTTTLYAQAEVVADISGRAGCDTAAYYDVERSLAVLTDSVRLTPLLRDFQGAPPDGYSIGLEFAPDGRLDTVEVVANGHSRRENLELGARIRPFVHPQAPPGRHIRVLIGVPPDSSAPVTAEPGKWTCHATLQNADDLQRRFDRSLRQLREARAVKPGAHGVVRLRYVVEADGHISAMQVDHSSRNLAVDSVAQEVARAGRFLPAVLGTHYSSMAIATDYKY
jgi:TonB family protein